MLRWILNKFLVKEIKETDGTLHFRRWCLFLLPWFRIYIHQICLPDYDKHLHDHPWNFLSIILKGSYLERYMQGPGYNVIRSIWRWPGSFIFHKRSDAHKIETTNGDVWTLVFAIGKYKMWGYRMPEPYDLGYLAWMDHVTYRKEKRAGLFD